jgi:formate-dependent nitrite reductase membrane component NrfD
VIGAVGAAATGALLVWDLKRPDRFYLLFTRGNHRSWLVLGGYALLGFGLMVTVWFVAGVAEATDAQRWLAVPAILVAALAAGYTAFLFGQAEGRDLWQSRWLLPHLLAQAAMTGAGALGVAVAVAGADDDAVALVARTLVVAGTVHLAICAIDLGGRHVSRRAEVAAGTIVRGRYRTAFWWGAVAPTVAAIGVAALGWGGERPWAVLAAGVAVQPALLIYETVYVRAGQDVPLS